MKSISTCLVPILLLSNACTFDDEAEVSEIVEEVNVADYASFGFSCEVKATYIYCVKCIYISDGGSGKIMQCMSVWCDPGANGECYDYRITYPAATFDRDLNFWFEAESGTLAAPMQKQYPSGASGGSSVVVPTTAGAGGSVTFSFVVPEGGATLYPWARINAPSSASNAFQYRIDGGAYQLWNTPVTGGAWSWAPVSDANGAPGTGIAVTAGTHTLRIYRVDSGTQLDRVLLTANPNFVPVADTYQAESGSRVPPMQVGSQSGPPSTGYVWVPNGAGFGGIATLITPVPHPGNYAVWGRVNAPSGNDDSFYVSANLGPSATWAITNTTATGWAWSTVRHSGSTSPFLFEMNGADFIQIKQREDGTKLDRIIVTNDPGFTPVDHATGGTGGL